MLAAWTIILILAGVYASQSLGSSVSTDITFCNDPESTEGFERIEVAGLSGEAPIGETMVIHSLNGASVDDPAFQARNERQNYRLVREGAMRTPAALVDNAPALTIGRPTDRAYSLTPIGVRFSSLIAAKLTGSSSSIDGRATT